MTAGAGVVTEAERPEAVIREALTRSLWASADSKSFACRNNAVAALAALVAERDELAKEVTRGREAWVKCQKRFEEAVAEKDDDANTWVDKLGKRHCRICQADRQRRRRERLKSSRDEVVVELERQRDLAVEALREILERKSWAAHEIARAALVELNPSGLSEVDDERVSPRGSPQDSSASLNPSGEGQDDREYFADQVAGIAEVFEQAGYEVEHHPGEGQTSGETA